ncbi:MAG: hypothetical protein DRG63_08505 [Deltaproteobacteria bacterium]|nr:MAG: hypothetical protein DRG63_08505 [Deltaproteobacteria bacterium]
MRVEKDYEDLLRLLNKYEVKYCIVGAFAVAYYAKPRYTKDIDILVEPSQKNAENLLKALHEFGFGSLALSTQDFTELGQIIQLGYEPIRIDIITSIEGIDFKQIWQNRVTGSYGNLKVPFIGLLDLIACKKASNRSQDLADLEILKKALEAQK